jgi:hypothetical protein
MYYFSEMDADESNIRHPEVLENIKKDSFL